MSTSEQERVVANQQRRSVMMVDGSNLYATCKALSFHVDYKRLLDYLIPPEELLRAYYFTAVLDRAPEEFDALRTQLDYMAYNGWRVVTKQAKQYTNELTGHIKTKGNVDIDMACLAMKLAPSMDNLFLVSGDGDFSILVDYLQTEGVYVTVVSSHKNTRMVGDELRRQCDRFIDMSDIMQHIGREPSKRLRV